MSKIQDLTLYFSNGSDEPVPVFELVLPGGFVRTNPETFTQDELNAVGLTGPYKKPAYDPSTQLVEWDAESTAFVVKSIPEKTDEEKWKEIRDKRNRLLAESDWSMVVDVPGTINKHEWRLYRQRLRDLTTSGDPNNIIWPVDPFNNTEFQDPVREEPKIQWEIEDIKVAIADLQKKIQELSSI